MERTAYEQVVMEQKDRIFAYATMMLRNATEAQDVAQEVLIRLWKHRDRVETEGAPHWLRRAAHNLCIDQMRRRRVRAESPDVELDLQTDHDRPDPQRQAWSGEIGSMIEVALDSLPERDRAVLVMREIQGLPYAEIADTLDVPLGTLKARLHRAREQLRARLVQAGVTP